MGRTFYPVAAVVAAAILLTGGCGQAAPAPTPTTAAAPAKAAPTKAAAPTSAAAPTKAPAQPTKAPAPPTPVPTKAVDFPQKGKAITALVPYPAGGGVDVGARIVTPAVEKVLGVPVQVVNKGGASTQVGSTEVSLAKPDGYTQLWTAFPTFISSYLDPTRKAVYSRKSFVPVAQTNILPTVAVVKADSPYKSMKDLVDAAKANPEKIPFGVGPLLSSNEIPTLLLEKEAGVKFAPVRFEGSAPMVPAVLGGHIEGAFVMLSDAAPQVAAGTMRALGIADSQESPLLAGVKTVEAQGYKVISVAAHLIYVPAGTPAEVVDVMSKAIGQAMANSEVQDRAKKVGLIPRYLNQAQAEDWWNDQEAQLKPLVEAIRKQ